MSTHFYLINENNKEFYLGKFNTTDFWDEFFRNVLHNQLWVNTVQQGEKQEVDTQYLLDEIDNYFTDTLFYNLHKDFVKEFWIGLWDEEVSQTCEYNDETESYDVTEELDKVYEAIIDLDTFLFKEFFYEVLYDESKWKRLTSYISHLKVLDVCVTSWLEPKRDCSVEIDKFKELIDFLNLEHNELYIYYY